MDRQFAFYIQQLLQFYWIPFYYKLYRILDYLLIHRNKKVSAAPWRFYSSELVNSLKSYTIYIINNASDKRNIVKMVSTFYNENIKENYMDF